MNNEKKSQLEELQESEYGRFQRASEINGTTTRNPIGLRFSNIERAFTVVAASKFVGWTGVKDSKSDFCRNAIDVIEEYLDGSYIDDLRPEYANELRDSSTSESWFDFVQLSLYLAFHSDHTGMVERIAEWVSPTMRYDSGIEEVSHRTNLVYVGLCMYLRNGALSSEIVEKLEKQPTKKRDKILSRMLLALNSENENDLRLSLMDFAKCWKPDSKSANPAEIISIDVSNICNAWLHTKSTGLSELDNQDFLHLNRG